MQAGPPRRKAAGARNDRAASRPRPRRRLQPPHTAGARDRGCHVVQRGVLEIAHDGLTVVGAQVGRGRVFVDVSYRFARVFLSDAGLNTNRILFGIGARF